MSKSNANQMNNFLSTWATDGYGSILESLKGFKYLRNLVLDSSW